MSLSGECPMRTGIKSRLVSIFYSARCDGTDLAYFTVRKVTSNVWETKCQSKNYLIPRQNCKKNQMYNWFDKYKQREQQKVYILNCEPQEKTRLRTPLVRRRSLKEV